MTVVLINVLKSFTSVLKAVLVVLLKNMSVIKDAILNLQDAGWTVNRGKISTFYPLKSIIRNILIKYVLPILWQHMLHHSALILKA